LTTPWCGQLDNRGREALEGEVLANLDPSEREQLRELLARAMDGQDPNFVCDE